ncbi:MAG: ABC-2 transporter permease [Bacillota bacterium]
MKSLVLKDLFNIGHNAKSMFLMLLVFAFVLVPLAGLESYIIASGILCSMMIVTTFVFDDNSKWTKYAMIMPFSKKELVASKFIVLLIFSAIGVVVGLILGTIGGVITHKIAFNAESITTLLFMTLAGLVIAEIFGSMSIPLVFKFGAERGRMLLLVSFLVPAAICFGIYQVLVVLGVSLTDQLIFILICCSPLIALIWNYVMYRISYNIFSHQDSL